MIIKNAKIFTGRKFIEGNIEFGNTIERIEAPAESIDPASAPSASAFDSSVYGEATAEITDYDIYISEVSVSPSSYSMYPGETANFSAVVTDLFKVQ